MGQLMGALVTRAALTVIDPRAVMLDGAYLRRDGEREGYLITFEGERRIDWAEQHREEWAAR